MDESLPGETVTGDSHRRVADPRSWRRHVLGHRPGAWRWKMLRNRAEHRGVGSRSGGSPPGVAIG